MASQSYRPSGRSVKAAYRVDATLAGTIYRLAIKDEPQRQPWSGNGHPGGDTPPSWQRGTPLKLEIPYLE
jgi:hypothetical protein